MSHRSLQNRWLSCTTSVAAALLSCIPAMASPLADTQKNLKSVIVSVDFIDVSLADLHKASQGMSADQKNDGRLLAALIKSGAHDTKGVRLQVWDRYNSERDETLTTTTPSEGMPPSYTVGFTRADPHINQDGTISIFLEVGVNEVKPIPVSVPIQGTQRTVSVYHEKETNIVQESVTSVFRDGQTIKIGSSPYSAAGIPSVHLTFARTDVATGQFEMPELEAVPPVASTPIAPFTPSTPFFLALPSDPRTLDPGIIAYSPAKPEGMDHINILPPPVPAAAEPKAQQ